ncbi:hypothetical protein [Komagataeibacter saccharivorans]|uniref:Uncharacterized protein n=1 Tax=Komagataeibacter saccharivorans TaxID=265959 RepID=A0A347W9F5_9PROT|nr:hypothetical protein [Komagataeibacter saccharivorans]AXY21498.1 hypothetical protein CD178_00685 [Komagataeibacter saccharivorans]PYD51627.1 hypothetical protein CFR79_03735 [Komagataeibacter saccharivorans]QBL94602.1 hypothetical protein KSAC_24120 [Komagataeibacter saccharivorans]GBQ42681.1 hypothetical protein AA0614_2723 [Komagataeibacter saccharivorans NRIC 0614]
MTSSFVRKALLATVCALAVAHMPGGMRPAMAQQPTQQQELTPEQQAAIQRDVQTVAQYRLPDDFFARMLPVIQQIKLAHINPPETPSMTLEETIQRTQSMPQLLPILQRNRMSPREFVMNITTFGMTQAVLQHPPQDSKDMPPLNPHNITLIKTHQPEVQALLQAMGGGQGGQQAPAR